MAIYKLEFDWWTVEDEDKPWYEQEQRVYYFTHAEDALDFVDRVVWNEAAYVSMGSPINAYLISLPSLGSMMNEIADISRHGTILTKECAKTTL